MNKIKQLRKEHNVTQVQLAKHLGITKDYVSIIERGYQTPSFHLAKAIADFFGQTVDAIFFADQPNKTFESNKTKQLINM